MSDAPIATITPDEIIYRASTLGGCLRKLWAARSGMEAKPPTAKMQAIFDRGHELEPIILELLTSQGWTLTDHQGEVIFAVHQPADTATYKTLSVVGHYDAMGSHPQFTQGRSLPVDVKGFGPDLIREYLGHQLSNLPHYEWQQSVYAIGCGVSQYVMPVYDKENEMILRSSLYPHDAQVTIDMIEQKLLIVERMFINSEMPDCEVSYPCPFYYLHDEPLEKPPLPANVTKAVDARMKVDAKIKVFTLAKDKLSEVIKSTLGEKEQSYDHEGTTVAILPNPNKFNTKAAQALLTEAGIDWANDPEYQVPGVGYQLRVTPPKAEKKGRKTDG